MERRFFTSPNEKSEESRAVFLDRDGTINKEKNYLYRFDDWEWINGAIESIRILNRNNFLVIIVSNQSGISRGFYEVEDVDFLHNQVLKDLEKHNAYIDAIYFCPHHPEFDFKPCNCRKPGNDMILDAAKKFNIDLSKSWIIGDKISDCISGIKSGASCILVKTGYGKSEVHKLNQEFDVKESIKEAVSLIISNPK